MNGAAPEMPRTTRTPSSNSSTITGVSHHFLLWQTKYQNSLRDPPASLSASCAKSLRGARVDQIGIALAKDTTTSAAAES
jgi:hypothetical protein